MIAKRHRFFSDRLSQNRQRGSSDKIAKSQSDYLASRDRQITIAYLAIKERKNCRIYLAIISSRSPVIISDINTPNGQRSFSDADDVMMTSSSQKRGDMGYVPKSTE